MQDVERESQRGVGNCENSLWVDAEAYTKAEGALNADAKFVALVVDGLLEEASSSSGPITRSFSDSSRAS